jgi:hypothetical protein
MGEFRPKIGKVPSHRPIAVIVFVVPGVVVGKNQAAVPGVDHDGERAPWRVRSAEARAYCKRIASIALASRSMEPKWPADVWRVTDVRISAQAYDDRHDVDAKTLLLQDALTGILYWDDRVVGWGANPRPILDGSGSRLEVQVELLQLRSAAEARRARDVSIQRNLARQRRQARRRSGIPRWMKNHLRRLGFQLS